MDGPNIALRMRLASDTVAQLSDCPGELPSDAEVPGCEDIPVAAGPLTSDGDAPTAAISASAHAARGVTVALDGSTDAGTTPPTGMIAPADPGIEDLEIAEAPGADGDSAPPLAPVMTAAPAAPKPAGVAISVGGSATTPSATSAAAAAVGVAAAAMPAGTANPAAPATSETAAAFSAAPARRRGARAPRRHLVSGRAATLSELRARTEAWLGQPVVVCLHSMRHGAPCCLGGTVVAYAPGARVLASAVACAATAAVSSLLRTKGVRHGQSLARFLQLHGLAIGERLPYPSEAERAPLLDALRPPLQLPPSAGEGEADLVTEEGDGAQAGPRLPEGWRQLFPRVVGAALGRMAMLDARSYLVTERAVQVADADIDARSVSSPREHGSVSCFVE